jgi:hypothetical protein
MFEMRMIDVRIDAKQPLEDDLHHVNEIVWERHAILLRENCLIVQLQPGATSLDLSARRCHRSIWVCRCSAADVRPHAIDSDQKCLPHIAIICILSAMKQTPMVDTCTPSQSNRAFMYSGAGSRTGFLHFGSAHRYSYCEVTENVVAGLVWNCMAQPAHSKPCSTVQYIMALQHCAPWAQRS